MNIVGPKIVVEAEADNRIVPEQTVHSVSAGAVKKKLKELNTKKATHSNDFPAWITKLCAEDICLPLTDILNCMFATCKFPNKWKVAEVCPLPFKHSW